MLVTCTKEEIWEAVTNAGGFGFKVLAIAEDPILRANISDSTRTISPELISIFDNMMALLRIPQAASFKSALLLSGGIPDIGDSALIHLVNSAAASHNAMRGLLWNCALFAVLWAKLTPKGFTVTTEVPNKNWWRGGRVDTHIKSPSGKISRLEAKTTVSNHYKMTLHELAKLPHYMVMIGNKPYDLSKNKIARMRHFGQQPVVANAALASKKGIYTIEKMVEEITKGEPTGSKTAPPVGSSASV